MDRAAAYPRLAAGGFRERPAAGFLALSLRNENDQTTDLIRVYLTVAPSTLMKSTTELDVVVVSILTRARITGSNLHEFDIGHYNHIVSSANTLLKLRLTVRRSAA